MNVQTIYCSVGGKGGENDSGHNPPGTSPARALLKGVGTGQESFPVVCAHCGPRQHLGGRKGRFSLAAKGVACSQCIQKRSSVPAEPEAGWFSPQARSTCKEGCTALGQQMLLSCSSGGRGDSWGPPMPPFFTAYMNNQ
ncbi:UNVERIFIED_CONTAM: hypothetical protein K2H54_037189 [Gekko kuhli]